MVNAISPNSQSVRTCFTPTCLVSILDLNWTLNLGKDELGRVRLRHKPILSPLDGIFHRGPSPGHSSLTEETDRIEVGDVIGLIETTNSTHELKADVRGELVRFLVTDHEVVVGGQPIAEVKL